MPLTNPPNSWLDRALDEWSDFAIDSWVYALRFAIALGAAAIFAILTGKFAERTWSEFVEDVPSIALLIFGAGVLLAVAYRIERAFSRERITRHAPENGGRTRPAKRERFRQRGNRKRKGKR